MTHVAVTTEGRAATIRLARPPLNILTLEMMREISKALEACANDQDVRVAVIRSGVDGVFSAGADVREHLPERVEELIRTMEALVRQILTYPKPTMCVVQGKCLGGGMELAIACDFIVATPDAVFGQPEVKLGVFPPVALALLPRLVGVRATHDIVLTGRDMPAEEAAKIGLITRVVATEDLEPTVADLEKALAANSSIVMGLAKRGIRQGLDLKTDEALRQSSELYLKDLMATQDALEGLKAFLEKRKPEWKDR